MIDVQVSREKGGYRIVVSGHACYAPEGQDIVCSAVSALVIAAAGYLRECRCSACRVITLERGYAELSCSRRGRDAMRMVYIGLNYVSRKYPEHVSIHGSIFEKKSP